MNRIVVLTGLVAATALLSACSLVDRFTDHWSTPTAEAPGQIEPVHAAVIAQDQAVFWVSSNGCTQKADLTPVVRRARGESIITLRRIKEDLCLEPRAEGVEMRWTFQELGLEPGSRVSVENPYQLPRS